MGRGDGLCSRDMAIRRIGWQNLIVREEPKYRINNNQQITP